MLEIFDVVDNMKSNQILTEEKKHTTTTTATATITITTITDF